MIGMHSLLPLQWYLSTHCEDVSALNNGSLTNTRLQMHSMSPNSSRPMFYAMKSIMLRWCMKKKKRIQRIIFWISSWLKKNWTCFLSIPWTQSFIFLCCTLDGVLLSSTLHGILKNIILKKLLKFVIKSLWYCYSTELKTEICLVCEIKILTNYTYKWWQYQ